MSTGDGGIRFVPCRLTIRTLAGSSACPCSRRLKETA